MFGIKKKSDAELIELIASGKSKSKAFSEFYDRTEKGIRTYISYMIGNFDDREDLFQETYSAFYRKVTSGLLPEVPRGYLRQIARNLIYKYYRDKKEHANLDSIPEQAQNDSSLEDSELVELIKKAVDILEPKYKEVFVLKEFEGKSHQEIAVICDLTVPNSRSRLFRAYKQINEILKPYINELKDQKWIK